MTLRRPRWRVHPCPPAGASRHSDAHKPPVSVASARTSSPVFPPVPRWVGLQIAIWNSFCNPPSACGSARAANWKQTLRRRLQMQLQYVKAYRQRRSGFFTFMARLLARNYTASLWDGELQFTVVPPGHRRRYLMTVQDIRKVVWNRFEVDETEPH